MTQTKRELREERKAAREAAERAEAHAAARRRRTFRLLGALGLAAVVVAVAAVISASSGAPDEVDTNSSAASLVAGIPEKDGVLGDPNAPITITEFVDPQCPICADASKQALPHLIENYVRPGKVKLDARTLSFLGPDSVKAAQFAAGAKEQGKLWPFLEAFYANQGSENSGYVTDEFLTDVAKASGVDADKAFAFAKTQGAQESLDTADADAQTLNVDSTPTFVMKRNGTNKVIAVGAEDLQAKLDEALS